MTLSTARTLKSTEAFAHVHIRHYPRGTAIDQHDLLHIAIKQYTPLDNPEPSSGDVTFIAAHANAVGKELYEPLWDELYLFAKRTGSFRIRSVWIADVSFQGASYVLNEHKLGNDPSWFDHPRDLLHMINTFRDQMIRPLVGIGHSMGGNNIVNLSLMHPRLLASIILIDPVILRAPPPGGKHHVAYLSTLRRDVWPSREAAAESFRKNKFYQSWDPRVLDLWIKYGLRELPTALYPSYSSAVSITKTLPTSVVSAAPVPSFPSTDLPVTLRTPKHQEVFTFVRPNYPPAGQPLSAHEPERRTHPDVPRGPFPVKPFYRPEAIITFARLPHLHPRCLYIFADQSDMSVPVQMGDKLNTTGIGVDGNGGVESGGVAGVLMKGAGHFCPFERPGETASHVGKWLGEELARWSREEAEDKREWEATSARDRMALSEDFVYWVKEGLGPGVELEKQQKPKL